MNSQLQKAVIVFGFPLLLVWLITPGTLRKPKRAPEQTPDQQRNNANIVANAYWKALHAKESAEGLEELNKQTEAAYGMRVYKKHSDGKYYVADTKGNDIFKIS